MSVLITKSCTQSHPSLSGELLQHDAREAPAPSFLPTLPQACCLLKDPMRRAEILCGNFSESNTPKSRPSRAKWILDRLLDAITNGCAMSCAVRRFCTESGTEVHLETLALCRITFSPLVRWNSASINLINAWYAVFNRSLAALRRIPFWGFGLSTVINSCIFLVLSHRDDKKHSVRGHITFCAPPLLAHPNFERKLGSWNNEECKGTGMDYRCELHV